MNRFAYQGGCPWLDAHWGAGYGLQAGRVVRVDWKRMKMKIGNLQSKIPYWTELRRQDSNMRPPGYEPGELPTAPLRDVFLFAGAKVALLFRTAKFFLDYFLFKPAFSQKLRLFML